jgi:hypothetical protein
MCFGLQAICGLMNIWLAWPGGQAIASKSSFEFSTTTQYMKHDSAERNI